MRKLTFFLSAVFLFVFYEEENRDFISTGNNNFITVWKIFDKCYVMPYKYYGLIVPFNNYIRTSRFNTLTIIYKPNAANVLAVLNSGNECFYQEFDTFYIDYYAISRQEEFIKKYACGDKICSKYNYMIAYLRGNEYFVNDKLL